jgi:hypothetical protein
MLEVVSISVPMGTSASKILNKVCNQINRLDGELAIGKKTNKPQNEFSENIFSSTGPYANCYHFRVVKTKNLAN